jgi:hypothetical protein
MFLEKVKVATGVGNHSLHNVIYRHDVTQISLVIFKKRDMCRHRIIGDALDNFITNEAVFGQNGHCCYIVLCSQW